MQIDIIPVIVSSLGAVHKQSLRELARLFMCDEKEEMKIGRKLSEAAIAGSLEIWRRYVRKVMHGEDLQIRQRYTEQAQMANEEQGREEADDQANREGSEGEASELTGEVEAEIESEPGNEEGERQGKQGPETSEAGEVFDFLG
jgi:hypothetical protein